MIASRLGRERAGEISDKGLSVDEEVTLACTFRHLRDQQP
jgi:hypothetical protein